MGGRFKNIAIRLEALTGEAELLYTKCDKFGRPKEIRCMLPASAVPHSADEGPTLKRHRETGNTHCCNSVHDSVQRATRGTMCDAACNCEAAQQP